MDDHFDVAVLGGGPGGYEAAIRCAQYGLKTALIEARELGGTCLNRGCIPTKALLHGAEVLESAKGAGIFGITIDNITLDYEKLAAFKDAQVAKLRRGIQALEKSHGVTVISGRGTLESANEIRVEDKTVTARNVILATGSEPSLPPIPGIDGENVMTSDGVLAMTELPKSAVIIGGGVIGIEFATLLSALGCAVIVLEMLPGILPGVDDRIALLLRRSLQKKGVSIINSAKVVAIAPDATVTYELDGQTKLAGGEKCIVCTGRRPMTRDIGLEALGIAMERGYVITDERMETGVPGIYAIGDITGKMQLAHVASAQGLTAAAACAGKPAKMRYDIVPACIYTHPEIAYVGLTEEAAREAGFMPVTGAFQVAGNGRSAIMNESTGLCRIVADEATGRVLGAQIMAPRATDMIAEIAAVMRCEGTIEELSGTIHPHPTVSEIIMEAAHDAEGLCCHAMPKKRT